MTRLVTHTDKLLGRQLAVRFLRRSEHVTAHASARHPHPEQLRRAGAKLVCHDLHTQSGLANLEWCNISSIVHASVSGAAWGREAVLSLSDLGVDNLVQAAERAGVQRLVLLHPPTLEIQARLTRSPLPYTLLCPAGPERAVMLPGGARGRVLERRRLISFMPLLRVVEVMVTASGGSNYTTLVLPTLVRRYSSVIDEIEQLVRRPETPVADSLLSELVMGSPYKLITPSVARALGLEFPRGYCKQVFSALEG